LPWSRCSQRGASAEARAIDPKRSVAHQLDLVFNPYFRNDHSGASTMSSYIESYNHNHKIGVLIEFRAIDDFTFQTEEFQALARDIAIHIIARDPARDGQSVLSLLGQRFVKDESKSVREVLQGYEAQLKGDVRVLRYVRYSIDDADH
jgi:translation elongation factor EF-Ts